MAKKKMTVETVRSRKGADKLVVVTAYDYSFATMIDEAGADIALVGDSLGMVVYGEKTTHQVTMDDMIRHTRAVSRGVKRALIVTDMPINSFRTPDEAVANARRLIDVGAGAVKIEGEQEVIPVIQALLTNGIDVMGHVGLTPQTFTDYKVQGKSQDDAKRILNAAQDLAHAGVFSLVIECVPRQLGALITARVAVPTIGIGAGPDADGQVLVCYDMLGIYPPMKAKFVRVFGNAGEAIREALGQFRDAVRDGSYPSTGESFTMNENDLPE